MKKLIKEGTKPAKYRNFREHVSTEFVLWKLTLKYGTNFHATLIFQNVDLKCEPKNGAI